MCEITNGKIYVADKDIVCYKLLEKAYDGAKEYYKPSLYTYGPTGDEFVYKKGSMYFEDRFGFVPEPVKKVWMFNNYKKTWRRGNCHMPSTENAIFVRTLMWYDYSAGDIVESKNCIADADTYLMSSYGFYSYTYYMNGKMEHDLKKYSIKRKLVAAKFIIPEGAQYCVSDDGEVFISDRIIFDSIISK